MEAKRSIFDHKNVQRPKRVGPFTIFKKFKTLDDVTTLGEDVKAAIQQGVADPKFGLELDAGRAMVRIELEVVINPAALPIKDTYTFKADGLPKEASVD